MSKSKSRYVFPDHGTQVVGASRVEGGRMPNRHGAGEHRQCERCGRTNLASTHFRGRSHICKDCRLR